MRVSVDARRASPESPYAGRALTTARWLGVDVGGRRKGFDVALIDGRRILALEGRLTREQVVELVETHRPAVVAIDSPRCCAPDGQKTRKCEHLVNDAICRIRWTPDEDRVRGNPYYAWIEQGLALYDALGVFGADVIEVFPTASWTRLLGSRGNQSRAAWSRRGLAYLSLETSQCAPTKISETPSQLR